jgi:voltage-gated potassium channel
VPLFLIASRFVRTLSRRRAMALIGFAVVVVLGGGALFSLTQHISIGLGLYWAVVTATTVGYGDIDPKNTTGRVVAVAVMLLTIPTIGAVFAMWAGATVLDHVRRLFGMDSTLPSTPYTVVYGSNPVLSRALSELAASGDPLVLVATDRPVGLGDDLTMLAGDPTDEALIRQSQPTRANRALIACSNEADTLVVAVQVHALAPQLEIYALTQSPHVANALRELGVTHTLAADELVSHTLAKSLETPQAGDLLLQLVDTTSYRLIESPVDPSLVNQPLSHARARADALVLGISRGDKVDLGLADDPVLSADDRLIVLEQGK